MRTRTKLAAIGTAAALSFGGAAAAAPVLPEAPKAEAHTIYLPRLYCWHTSDTKTGYGYEIKFLREYSNGRHELMFRSQATRAIHYHYPTCH